MEDRTSAPQLAELEAILTRARASEEAARGVTMGAWRIAQMLCLKAERNLALAKGEETACALDWSPRWDAGASLPHLLAAGTRALLLYLVNETAPEREGTYVEAIDPAPPQEHTIALVEFTGCTDVRLGSPNDEVIHGHPLYGKGLEVYGAHFVENSRWLTELEHVNSIHPHYDPERSKARKHFLLLFHDETFECVAEGFTIEVFRKTFAEVVQIAASRLVEPGR